MRIVNFILIAFFCIFYNLSHTQNTSKIDSVQYLLQQHNTKDLHRVDLLNTKAELYQRIQIDSTFAYARAAYKLATTLNFQKGKAKGLTLISWYYTRNHLYEKAIKNIIEALIIYEELEDSEGISRCYRSLGDIEYSQHKLEKAHAYFQKMVALSERTNDTVNLVEALQLSGKIYLMKDNFDQAEKLFIHSLKLAKTIKYKRGTYMVLSSLANLTKYQSNFSEAIQYYNEALVIIEELGDKINVPSIYHSIGAVYLIQENNTKAIEYLTKALEKYKKNGQTAAIIRCLNDLGVVYKNEKKYQLAHTSYKEALQIVKKIKSEGIAIISNNIGHLYILQENYVEALHYLNQGLAKSIEFKSKGKAYYSHLGLGKAYLGLLDFNKALRNAQKSLEIVKELDIIEHRDEIHELLANIYFAKDNYKKAYEHQALFKEFYDRFFNKETTQKIAQIEANFKYKEEILSAELREEKLVSENERASQELTIARKQQLLTVIGLLTTILLLVTLFFSYRIRNLNLENKNILTEQKLSRIQMTPHFMFNSLSVLQGIIVNNENVKAMKYLSKFSSLLRLSLENSRNKFVLLSNEIKALKNYIDIQNIARHKPFIYEIQTETLLEHDTILIPPMLIQPFVENAIEHGFQEEKNNQKIMLTFSLNNRSLTCKVIDNGIGIQSNTQMKDIRKTSLSTQIIIERLVMLSKQFKTKAGIVIENKEPKGTIVTLQLPYKLTKHA